MYKNVILWFCLLYFIGNCESAKILAMFSAASHSHKVIFRPYINGLMARGHEVVIVTADLDYPNGGGPEKLKEIGIHDIAYNSVRDGMLNMRTGRGESLYTHFSQMFGMINKQGYNLYNSEVMKNLLKDQSFDLILVEAFHEALLAIAHLLKRPVIKVSSLGSINNYEVIGAPIHPLLYPEIVTQRMQDLSLLEEIKEVANYLGLQYISYDSENKFNEFFQQKYPGLPTIRELQKNVNALLLNTNPMWEENRPVPIGVAYTLGLMNKKGVGLSEDLKKYLDSSENGVIYVSFGTNVFPSRLPVDRIQILMKVLSEVPYSILLKWDKDDIQGLPKNLKIVNWCPQLDVLKHPKVKLFITQGGLHSTEEAINAGVPLIGIPIIFDQFNNAEKYERHGIGKKIEIETMTEHELRDAIETIMGDDSYHRNVLQFRKLMYDTPQDPVQRAVWLTEYILRHGDVRHLRSPAADLTWAEYIELELLLIIFFTILIFIIIIIAGIVSLINSCRRNKASDTNVNLGAPYKVTPAYRNFT
ncbi:hypothetical protein ACJJTC_001945 [Scirpophaga incertulas]